jgi:hypothetical protein
LSRQSATPPAGSAAPQQGQTPPAQQPVQNASQNPAQNPMTTPPPKGLTVTFSRASKGRGNVSLTEQPQPIQHTEFLKELGINQPSTPQQQDTMNALMQMSFHKGSWAQNLDHFKECKKRTLVDSEGVMIGHNLALYKREGMSDMWYDNNFGYRG